MYKDAQNLVKNLRRQKPRKDKKDRLGKKSALTQAECFGRKQHWQNKANSKIFKRGNKTLVGEMPKRTPPGTKRCHVTCIG